MQTPTSNIEAVARAVCERQLRVRFDGDEQRLAADVDRYWHCCAAELEAGLIDETGAQRVEFDPETGLAAYRDWRARHPEYAVPPRAARD